MKEIYEEVIDRSYLHVCIKSIQFRSHYQIKVFALCFSRCLIASSEKSLQF